MKNKYIWVAFNLVASLLTLTLFLNQDPTGVSVTGDNAWIILLAFGAIVYWIYKTVIYWRMCIQADDPNFDLVVRNNEKK
ncbi:hypothetical protein MD588_24825 [Photobacterium sp. SDRW27]|uniref:hypothetical protein n=1 Tax=Photobacterium obscurum TaxID=2829490 RepID=UPI0022431526|nr:hypothetical protein [Photobacterium obscurum]MCW8332021.1 hypothetical protein [Photobacterium obscurum]